MSQIFVKPIVGDDPLSVLRREVCTMGGCPEGTAECFCDEIGRLNVRLNWIAKVINDHDYGTEEKCRLIRNHMSNVGLSSPIKPFTRKEALAAKGRTTFR